MTALQRRIIVNTFRAVQFSEWTIEQLVKLYLRTYTHPAGTKTPSPPGGPPALVTGNLRRSWRNIGPHPGLKPFTVEGGGGPTAVYARIQELGGQVTQLRTRMVHSPGGTSHAESFVHQFRLPRRPYVRPMALVARRAIRRIHIQQWSNAIRES